MDKEVELILSKLKIVSEEQERGLYLCDKEHSKLLLDYITNLQQENQELSRMCELYGKSLYNAELTDYKSRIEKAVNFINKHCVNHKISKEVGFKVYTMMVTDELEKVMKILENGRSDE